MLTRDVLFAQGNREIIDNMTSGPRTVLERVLKLIDTHDLYGRYAKEWRYKVAGSSGSPASFCSSQKMHGLCRSGWT